MKKITILLCLVLCALIFVGCSTKAADTTVESGANAAASDISNASSETSSSLDDWGVAESIVAESNYVLCRAYMRFPILAGIVEGTGKVARQPDGTMVILDAEITGMSPVLEDVSVDKIFPAYLDQAIFCIKDYNHSWRHSEYALSIKSQKNVTINDYEMCKYYGELTFKYDDVPYKFNYVSYATRLHSNNAVVYWMVIDESEDQSLGQLIETHADNMAKVLHE